MFNLIIIGIMNRFKLFFVALMCMMASNVAFADDKPIPVEQLPASAKQFVASNFESRKIIYAEKDWDSFECRLDDGTKIEFKRDGSWKKIDRESMTAVPASTVPDSIKSYVNANFPGCVVTKIEKERHGYDIELSNDMELKFNHQGVVIGFDD